MNLYLYTSCVVISKLAMSGCVEFDLLGKVPQFSTI